MYGEAPYRFADSSTQLGEVVAFESLENLKVLDEASLEALVTPWRSFLKAGVHLPLF